MSDLERSVDRIASRTAFSGVVRVDRGAETEFAKAYGFAHRGWGIPNEVDTRFGIASGTKGLTALTVSLGIWLHPSDGRVELQGSDAGVSFQTVHDPIRGFTYTVLSNTTDGAWPIVLHLDELFHW